MFSFKKGLLALASGALFFFLVLTSAWWLAAAAGGGIVYYAVKRYLAKKEFMNVEEISAPARYYKPAQTTPAQKTGTIG